MRNSDYRVSLAGLIILFASAGIHAQQPSVEQQLARAQGLLRQVSAQKQELEIANTRMAGELADLEKRLKKTESKLK